MTLVQDTPLLGRPRERLHVHPVDMRGIFCGVHDSYTATMRVGDRRVAINARDAAPLLAGLRSPFAFEFGIWTNTISCLPAAKLAEYGRHTTFGHVLGLARLLAERDPMQFALDGYACVFARDVPGAGTRIWVCHLSRSSSNRVVGSDNHAADYFVYLHAGETYLFGNGRLASGQSVSLALPILA